MWFNMESLFKIFVLCLSAEVVFCGAITTNSNENQDFWLDLGQRELQDAIQRQPNLKIAKNVILFIGDGMGVSTVTAARIYKGQKEGLRGEENELTFEKFPYVSLSKTYNVDKQVGDSAATGTAFLAGVKANSGTLGVDSSVLRGDCDGFSNTDAHVTSMMDWSLDAGKSAGVVTNTRITHATPAAAYANTPNRDWEKDTDVPDNCQGVKDIALQLLEDNDDISVILGGGRRVFKNRNDERNLPEEWQSSKQAENFEAKYVQNASEFRAVDSKNTDFLLGLFAESHMSYELERDNDEQPSMAEMVRKAIEILSKDKDGFFLFVEGGRIDHGHHDNYAKKALEDTIAFDEAVSVAKEMTGDDTLIVVTADHSHVFNIVGYPDRGNDILTLAKGRETVDNKAYTTLFYANGPGPGREEDPADVDTTANDYRFPTGVPMKAEKETHGGEDVAIYATGPWSHLFQGVYEQNYIAHVMGFAACVGPNTDNCQDQQ